MVGNENPGPRSGGYDGEVDALRLPAVVLAGESPTAKLDTVIVTIPGNVTPGGKLFIRL